MDVTSRPTTLTPRNETRHPLNRKLERGSVTGCYVFAGKPRNLSYFVDFCPEYDDRFLPTFRDNILVPFLLLDP